MKKVYKNVLASALPQIMNIITNLILPAMIIMRFGSEINGLVSTTKVIVSYVSIVGAGIATATTQALYEPVAKSDALQIRGMLHASNKMFNKYGTIFCAICIVVAFLYPFCINTGINHSTIGLLILVMSISGASEFFVIGRCRSLLYANQKVYVCTTIQAISILVSLVVAIIMLRVGMGIVIVQLAISLVYVLRAVFLMSYVNKSFPELKNYKNEEPIYSATAKRKDAMIHQISGLAVMSSQATILTSIVGLNAASIYAVYNIVFSGLQSIAANLSTALTPFMGRELALNNRSKLIKMYSMVEFVFFNLVSFLYSVCIIMIVPFVELYTSKADINYSYYGFAVLFVFCSAFYVLKLPSSALINISGHFRETRWRAILEATLCVVLSVLFTMLLGKNGVLIGTGIALSWRCLDTIIYTNKYILSISNARSIKRILTVIITICCFGFLAKMIQLKVNSFNEWILWALLFTVISIFVILLTSIIFERETLRYLFDVLKKR